MPALTKFDQFIEEFGKGNHDLHADPIFAYLTDELPLATDTTRADIADLATGNGYTAGGEDIQNTLSEAGGVGTVNGTNIVWTAVGGTIGPFQYVVVYNQVGGLAGTNKLIGWADYGTPITLQIGETFTIDIVTALATITGTP